ncbi:hypothetical protein Acr_09g0006030 [Actinidia rufa]|uniref:Uncharacterized protein n=1 Tax=Actinidia rufa TaxID=165716 RepID=A0A7J0F8A0_9ERIC|nr:hypothetical protein Acr_09g0006030 [Actinidia rufa]
MTTVSTAAGAVSGKRLSDGELVILLAIMDFLARIWAEPLTRVVQRSLCPVSSSGFPPSSVYQPSSGVYCWRDRRIIKRYSRARVGLVPVLLPSSSSRLWAHAQECPNKNKKKKAFTVITWDDVSDSEDMRKVRVVEMTEISLLLPHLSTLVVMCQNLMVKLQKSSSFTDSDSEENESGDEGIKYVPLKDAYDKLYEESLRLNKVNGMLSAKFKNKESECTKIAQELSEAQANLIQMKSGIALISLM